MSSAYSLLMLPWRQSLRGLAWALLAGVPTACFDGAASEGLPCRSDSDCGPALACENSCCGGSCLVLTSTTQPGTTSSDSTSSSSDSSSSGREESSTTSVEPRCGDGIRNGVEECDFELDDNCTPECTFAQPCGNERLDPGELCDPTDPEQLGDCAADCAQLVLFSWNENDSATQTDAAFCDRTAGDCRGWRGGASGPRLSGEYYDEPNPERALEAWPEAVLSTRAFTFPELQEEDVVRVELSHTLQLNFDDSGGNFADHAQVWLEVAGADPQLVLPGVPNTVGAETIACLSPQDACVVGDPPFCEPGAELAFAGYIPGQDMPFGLVQDPPSLAELQGRLRLRLRYDCSNFASGPAGEDDAWTVRGLQLTVVRPTR